MEENATEMSVTVHKYIIEDRVDLKGCTTIFLGRASDTGDIVAIKARDRSTKHKQMQTEAEVYQKIQGDVGIPCMKWFGTHGDESVLVLEYIGSTLEQLYNIFSRSFSLKTILMLADQILTRITYIHSRNFLHCNIAPDNFVIDADELTSIICLIDFGLAKKYRDERTFEHIPCTIKENEEIDIGTADYASINTHMGVAQSRRDDLEAVGYLLVYLCLGSLPWQGIKASDNREKCKLMAEKKFSTTTKSLCQGLPNEFVTYLDYCRQLRFDEVPNYLYLRALFRSLLNNNGFINDNEFDWNSPSDCPKSQDEVEMEEMEIKVQYEEGSTQLASDEVDSSDQTMMDTDAIPVNEDNDTESDSYNESMTETY
ncbi:casein kinase I-like [Teleopsis dalmanni]|uniref:casein kinase I-like n=1 Tax=Teleopsis dalmanni TaxID=139649 RepID=UPI0018CD669D|nr:casein kinase I-like [Teleopsis dalmanni]